MLRAAFAKASERFWHNVHHEALTGCWLWGGYLSDDGYSKFFLAKKYRFGHRVSYLVHVGEIPIGLVIDHKCRNRSCVNPDHLEPVTNDENMRRGHHATKAACKWGHPLHGDNMALRSRANGKSQRVCRTCEREKYTPKIARLGRRWGK